MRDLVQQFRLNEYLFTSGWAQEARYGFDSDPRSRSAPHGSIPSKRVVKAAKPVQQLKLVATRALPPRDLDGRFYSLAAELDEEVHHLDRPVVDVTPHHFEPLRSDRNTCRHCGSWAKYHEDYGGDAIPTPRLVLVTDD